jgi:hypothetical protein
LVALAAACGGGDGATGPGGGGLAGNYALVGANDEAVPTVVTSEVCSPAQILSGEMSMSPDGRWEMRFDWRDEDGQQWTGDHGRFQQAGDQLEFVSEAWGDRFEGEVDGGLVWFYYDFCNDNQGEDLDLAWSR